MQKTRRQSIVLKSPLPTTKPASSVKGFWNETMPRPAKEMDMMRTRKSLQVDDTRTKAEPQAERELGGG
jgi:hypothetical protein